VFAGEQWVGELRSEGRSRNVRSEVGEWRTVVGNAGQVPVEGAGRRPGRGRAEFAREWKRN